MIEHRKIMEKELKDKCFVCDFPYYPLFVHHIDGNKKNNKKENLLSCCFICHKIIHKGLSFLNRNFTDKTIEKILHYRGLWLLNTQKGNKEEIEEQMKFELILCKQSQSFISKRKCYFCGSKKNIKLICNPLITKYSKSPEKYSIPFCKRCLEDW